MHSKWVFKHFCPGSNKRNVLLAMLWGGGLLAGVSLCAYTPFATESILYGVMYAKPSLLSLFLIGVMPVLFTAVCAFTSLHPIAYVLILLSAITHGFSGTAIYLAVGSAAWIVRPLLLFTSSSTSVLMWWLLLQRNTRRGAHKQVGLALFLSLLVYLLDFFILSPLIGDLTKVL